jgi:hypothetical protein
LHEIDFVSVLQDMKSFPQGTILFFSLQAINLFIDVQF